MSSFFIYVEVNVFYPIGKKQPKTKLLTLQMVLKIPKICHEVFAETV